MYTTKNLAMYTPDLNFESEEDNVFTADKHSELNVDEAFEQAFQQVFGEDHG